MEREYNTIILGGGVAGLVAARRLRKRAPTSHSILLIDRNREHLFAPSLLWMLTGNRQPPGITRPLPSLEKKGVDFLQGTAEYIDPQERLITVDGNTFYGDYLIIALGAGLHPELIPGLFQAGETFYSLEGAVKLQQRLAEFRSGKIVVLTAAPAYKCPAAPYEAAMLLRSHYDGNSDVSVDIHAAEPGPMGVTGPEVSGMVRGIVESRGIGYFPDRQVSEVDPGTRTLYFNSGESTSYDLLAYVPPHQAPAVLQESQLTDDSGWIPVDRHTLETEHANVFAPGDNNQIMLEMGKPLPKAGTFAQKQAEAVVNTILSDLKGTSDKGRFTGQGACFLEIGDGKAGFGSGDFYHQPTPDVTLKRPNRFWRLGKVVFEKYWLWRWF